MIFTNREDAGRRLAMHLREYASHGDAIILGIPRGGVPVAFEIAKVLDAQLDVFLSRKLGVPGQEEFAFGAIAAGDGCFLDEQIIRETGISRQQVERITQDAERLLEQRAALYRGSQPPLQVEGRTVILVDDGIATGASMYAALSALRQMKPAKLVVAVPVAPSSTCNWLRAVADEFVCLYTPEHFYSVGQFYEHFAQVADEEVSDLLRRAAQTVKAARRLQDCAEENSPAMSAQEPEKDGSQREVSIDIEKIRLSGILSLPKYSKGIVLFAHGSGSSRHSPRNRYVADVLRLHGIATLLFDLLTSEEESVDYRTAELRFDIELLARRLVRVTQWIASNPDTSALNIGYFGASTGAAAALVAAAQLPNVVSAVVSRGGRPDLASAALDIVHAPTLLIVGGEDDMVVVLNRLALARLKCHDKRLVLVPGATHLFEEPGTLEEVARIAAKWFLHYLVPGSRGKEMGSSMISGAC